MPILSIVATKESVKSSVVFHDHPECWMQYEPWGCEDPDTGNLHHDGNGGLCAELQRIEFDTDNLTALERALLAGARCGRGEYEGCGFPIKFEEE